MQTTYGTAESPSGKTLHSIQYLRGFAATAVIAAHSLVYPLASDNIYLTILGRFGVILFFVISGFIIAVVSGKGSFQPIVFFEKRFVRVVPFYWFVTIGASAGALALPALFKNTSVSLAYFVKSALFIPFYNFGAGEREASIHPIVKLGWTLNYEVFFYICFGLLFFTSSRNRTLILTGLFLILFTIGTYVESSNAIFQFYTRHFILFFCSGLIIGHMYLTGAFHSAGELLQKIGTIGGAILLVVVLGFSPGFSTIARETTIMLFSVCIVLIALRMEITDKIPKISVLEIIGDASYSLYLVHIFWIGAITALFHKTNFFGIWTYPLNALLAATGGMAIGITVHYVVEKPLTQIIRGRLAAKRKPRQAQA